MPIWDYDPSGEQKVSKIRCQKGVKKCRLVIPSEIPDLLAVLSVLEDLP